MLDSIDYAILRELQREARISNIELAKRVNLSPTPCKLRVARLEKEGIITGYHARLSASKLGLKLIVFIQVSLKHTDEKTLNEFNQAMLEREEVMECFLTGGGFDYLVKIRIADMEAFRNFLANVLGKVEVIENTHSYFVMEEVRESFTLPVKPR